MRLRPAALLLTAGLCSAIPACSSAPRDPTPAAVRDAAAIESPRRRLEALAEIEAVGRTPAGPSLLEAARIIDPGLPRVLTPGTAEFSRAARPLDAILAEVAVEQPVSEIEQPSIDDRTEAARLYARARQALLSDRAEEAITLMESAVRLDPGAARLWQELGEARLATGDRPGGVDALTMAAELGSTDPRVSLTLASDAASRTDEDGVTRWAGAAWTRSSAGDAPERIIAGAMLGSGLLERGELLAGAQVLDETLRFADRRAPQPGEPVELVRLRARRAELGYRLGDAWFALGQPARAAEAYQSARAGLPRPPVALTQRTIAATAAAGRPAVAALEMLDHAAKRIGDLGAEEQSWLRGLSGIDRVGPAIADALAALADDESATPTGRRQVQRMLVRAPDPDEALRRIARRPALSRDPGVAADALRTVVPAQRVEMATQAVRADPAAALAWAAPLARDAADPLGLARSLLAHAEPARRALGVAMALVLDRPDLARTTIDLPPQEAPAIDPLVAAHLAGLAGRWARADDWLKAARAAAEADPSRKHELIAVLIACQRVSEAAALARDLGDDPAASADRLAAAAEFAIVSGDFERALALLERASAADPFDERVWERRVNLRAGETPVADQEATMRLGREISERRPRGELFAVLRARDLASAGMHREAAETIIRINERDPATDAGLQVLAQTAAAALEADDAQTATQVRAWIEDRLAKHPGSVELTLALARVMLAQEEAEPAFELLDDAAARIGHPELARNAEALLAQRLGRGDEALTRALDRLDGAPGVARSLERAETALLGGRWPTAVSALRDALPPGGELIRPQIGRWSNLAFGLVRAAESPERAAEAAAVIDEAAARGLDLPEELIRGQLLLIARTGDTVRLQAFVDEEVLGPDSGLIAVQALLGADRIPEALALLGAIAITDDGVYEDTLAEWARLAGAVGSASDAEAMIERLDEAGHTAEAAESLLEQFSPAPLPGEPTPARHRANIAYTAALVATVLERDDASEAMYRLALGYDPGHAWAANDLGYAIADRDGPLDEAEPLLELAYRVLPDESSTTDSLGWLRYKQGVLEDETDADGHLIREGALTLLLRASQMEDGRENPTILEHLGDTLWRLGRAEEARQAWISAEQFLRRSARELAASAQPNPRRADRINVQIRDLRRRLSDVEADREPAVAPSPALDPTPPPENAHGAEAEQAPEPVPFGGRRD